MGSPQTFSSGLELANIVVSSGILKHSLAAIISQQEGISPSPSPSPSVSFKVDQQPNFTIIAFFTWPACSKDYIQGGGGDLIPSSAFKETFPLFEFLSTKDNQNFSINKAALELFHSIRDGLPYLKSQVPLSLGPQIFFIFFFLT
jgi:hypothetical protein